MTFAERKKLAQLCVLLGDALRLSEEDFLTVLPLLDADTRDKGIACFDEFAKVTWFFIDALGKYELEEQSKCLKA